MVGLKFMLCVFAIKLASAQNNGPVVHTSHGAVRGSWAVTTNGRRIASFRGIPYASPPIRENRFHPPQPLPPWKGERNATQFGASCLQYQVFSQIATGDEDCLFLNVFTPFRKGAEYPVLIFFHGGAYLFSGSSAFDVSHLMDSDVVVVTLNYRLGPFGFICTGDREAPGNAGLKDQVFAMQWVQKNIRMFGGNPDSITLAGQSSGAGSVHYHFLSPMSEGLFHRGIAFSGTALSSWNFDDRPVEKAKRLASLVGCSETTSKAMMECLRRAYGEDIINAQVKMFDWKLRFFSPFTPVTEPADEPNAFLTEHPYTATRRGAMKKLPLIIMTTCANGLYPSAALQKDNLLLELRQRWAELAENIFMCKDKLPPAMSRSMFAKRIQDYYLNGKTLSQDNFDALTEALTDRLYGYGVADLAYYHAKNSGQPTRVGQYCFRGDYSVSSLLAGNNNDYGACNGDDVLHVFKGFGLDSNSTDDKAMEDLLNDMLFNYCLTGVPKLPGNVEWLPVTPRSSKTTYLTIMSPTQMEMRTAEDYSQRYFWNSLGLIENENQAKDPVCCSK